MLQSIVDTLTTAFAKGDLKTIQDTLLALAMMIKEMLPKVSHGKSHKSMEKLFKKISKLMGKLSARKAKSGEIHSITNGVIKAMRNRKK